MQARPRCRRVDVHHWTDPSEKLWLLAEPAFDLDGHPDGITLGAGAHRLTIRPRHHLVVPDIALARMVTMTSTHYQQVLAQLSAGHPTLTTPRLTDRQQAWADRRARTAHRADMRDTAATAAVSIICVAIVSYTYTVGGLLPAAAAAALICAAAALGWTRAG